ncbi:MAG: ABC transporter permease subunit [Planctomycetes bacterium]|nr:ABC transporter permease subunit [Planctomycetota bacterium]
MILATTRKELMSYLFSPVAYIIAVILYLWRGAEVYRLVYFAADAHYDTRTFLSYYIIYGGCTYAFCVLVPPILTMRCFAEERRTGSLEVLMTAPVRDAEIVLGKWLAALVFYGLLWLPTLVILQVLASGPFLDQSFHLGTVVSGYLGLALLGSALLAFGVFTSSLTDNVLLASMLGIIFNLAVMTTGMVQPYLRDWLGDSYLLNVFIEQTSVFEHLRDWFGRGQVDSSKVVFYLAATALFLFLTVRSLETRKWR